MTPLLEIPLAQFCLSAGDWSAPALLFALLIGHALCDFALQGDFLSVVKNRHAKLDRFFGDEKPPRGLWLHGLSAHSILQAAPVWILTGSVILAFIEFVLHWLIDFAKCERWISFNVDQALHIACKVAYVVIISYQCSWIQS